MLGTKDEYSKSRESIASSPCALREVSELSSSVHDHHDDHTSHLKTNIEVS